MLLKMLIGIIYGLILIQEVVPFYPNSISDGGGYEYNDNNQVNKYLPAPPGQTPPCAKNGATFCENIPTYPREAIRYLLFKYSYTYSLFIKSESDQEFFTNENMNYGLPSYDYGNNFNRSNPQQESFSYSNFNHNYAPSPSIIPEHPVAAAVVPILHSIWWNHIDRNNRRSFPYLPHNNFYRHFQRRKRQAPENQLCQVNSRFVTPEAAMNNEGNWMYVVNNSENPRYAQQVRIETCLGNGVECNGLCQVPPGYRAVCKQKYTQKRLVALDGSGTNLRNGVFWIPLCCVCEIQRL